MEVIYMPTEQDLNDFKGYRTQYTELTLDNLSIHGKIPEWLSGSFISNGPAQFEIGKNSLTHWFDGFAMLKKFTFKDGKVSFRNRFLHSEQYIKSNEMGQLYENEFATPANKSALGRLGYMIKNVFTGIYYDNCNINITKVGEHFIAMTESNDTIAFGLHQLNTIDSFKFNDTMKAQLSTAHPHLDIHTGELINVCIEIGKTNKYHVYKISAHSTKREIIKTYLSDALFYMHSFSITKNYIILFKSPLVINKWKLIFGCPFNDTLSWDKKNDSTLFIIIDKRNGSVQEIETDAFVCLHSANAYENNNEIILDLICYQDNPYSYFYLSNLRIERPKLPNGVLKRYTVNLVKNNCMYTTFSNVTQEFPALNYRQVNGNKYQFLYTNLITHPGKKFFNSIQKLNVETGNTIQWDNKNYYGETVFVAKNNESSETNGILLTIGYNPDNQCSSLIMLDANDMQQIAEVPLPLHLPFGLHGHFYHH